MTAGLQESQSTDGFQTDDSTHQLSGGSPTK